MKEPIPSVDGTYLVTPKQRRQAATKRPNAKFEEIREQLRAMALEKGPGSQLPSIRELCSLLNTSSITLTAALDLLETEHILYRKERQGIFVAETINQRVIHIVFNVFGLTDTGTSPFWSLLWAHLVQETEHRISFKNEQYQFHFVCRPYGQVLPDDYVALLNSSQASGCLLIGINSRLPDHTTVLQVPHVVIAGGGDIIVQGDAGEKARLGTQALVERGCRKIACWLPLGTPYDENCSPLEGNEVFQAKQVLSQYTVPFYPELFRHVTQPPLVNKKPLNTQEQGYLLVKQFFNPSNATIPDGVYISDDMMTSGALVAWEEMGIHVGRDIQVATHANAGSPILFGKTKQMIVVEYDIVDFARAMFSLLDGAMAHEYARQDQVINIRPRLRLYE